MKRRYICSAHGVRSIRHRIPERQRQELRGDWTDCCETIIAFSRKYISESDGNRRTRRDCGWQGDLNTLQIAASISADSKRGNGTSDRSSLPPRLPINPHTKCPASTSPYISPI